MKPFLFAKAEQRRATAEQSVITDLALADLSQVSGGTSKTGTTVVHNPSTGTTCSGPDEFPDVDQDYLCC